MSVRQRESVKQRLLILICQSFFPPVELNCQQSMQMETCHMTFVKMKLPWIILKLKWQKEVTDLAQMWHAFCTCIQTFGDELLLAAYFYSSSNLSPLTFLHPSDALTPSSPLPSLSSVLLISCQQGFYSGVLSTVLFFSCFANTIINK